MHFVYISATQRAIGLLAGLSMVGIGIVVDNKSAEYMGFIRLRINPIAILLKIIGAFIFASGFFGCCKATRSHLVVVAIYAVFQCLLLVAQVLLILLAVMFHEEVMRYVRQELQASMFSYKQQPASELTSAWNHVHKQFHCCGTNDFSDWKLAHFLPSSPHQNASKDHNTTPMAPINGSSVSVPDSCCVETDYWDGCGLNVTDVSSWSSHIYTQGCAEAMMTWVRQDILPIAAFFVSLVFIQMTGVILACTLAKNICEETRKSKSWTRNSRHHKSRHHKNIN